MKREASGARNVARRMIHEFRVPRQRGFDPMRHRGRYWVRRGRSNSAIAA